MGVDQIHHRLQRHHFLLVGQQSLATWVLLRLGPLVITESELFAAYEAGLCSGNQAMAFGNQVNECFLDLAPLSGLAPRSWLPIEQKPACQGERRT